MLVPAYNEAAGLAASLASIRAAPAAFTARGWTVELIVCDNNSSDATPAIAAAADARVVFEPVNQIGRARNAAAGAAAGDWLVFVDADSHPTAALFAAAADAMASGRCLAGGSTVRMTGGTWLGDALVGGMEPDQPLTALGGRGVHLHRRRRVPRRRRLQPAPLRHRGNRPLPPLEAAGPPASGAASPSSAGHPLRTSGRKMHLYTPIEMARLALHTAVTGGRTLRRPTTASSGMTAGVSSVMPLMRVAIAAVLTFGLFGVTGCGTHNPLQPPLPTINGRPTPGRLAHGTRRSTRSRPPTSRGSRRPGPTAPANSAKTPVTAASSPSKRRRSTSTAASISPPPSAASSPSTRRPAAKAGTSTPESTAPAATAR